jgi:hypothetical protein
MKRIEEDINIVIKEIDGLHYLIERTKWNNLNRDGFVFELERTYDKLKSIYSKLTDVNKELSGLLEKNTPDLTEFLEKLRKEIVIIESNIKMEKTKKMRIELINETEEIDVPELYSSIQNKIMELTLKCRYSAEKVRTFIVSRKTPFVKSGSTAKNLLEILEKKEDELSATRKQNLELKRKSFLGSITENDINEIESELNEKDKNLEIAIRETNSAMKTHLAQLNYVEGSFKHLKEKINFIEESHERFKEKAVRLIKELKKERDYARKLALEIEQETISTRSNYTKEILNMQDHKNEYKQKIAKKYEEDIKRLKKELNEKSLAMSNILKLVEEQENQIKKLKHESFEKSIYD